MRFKLLSIFAIVAFVAALAFSGCNNSQPPAKTQEEVVVEEPVATDEPIEGEVSGEEGESAENPAGSE